MNHRSAGRALLASLAIGAAVMAPAPAQAQAQTTAPNDEAESLIRRGVELRSSGQDAEALALFQQAWTLTRSPRARAQIGLAEQALGRWIDADDHIGEALDAAADPWVLRNRAALEGARVAVRRRLSTLDVRDAPAGAELWVNGTRRATLPLREPIRVVAGTVAIELRAAGYRTVQRDVIVEAGVAARESVTMLPSGADSAGQASGADSAGQTSGGARAGVAPSQPSPLRTAGIVALAAGGVVTVGAIIAHAVRESTAARWNSDECLSPTGATRGETCPNEWATLQTTSTLSVVSYVAGGTLVAAGAVLLGLGATRDAREAPARASVRCAPDFARPGLVCGASF
jgi:tetratricopeptide (TPR) repeat protein